MKNKWMILFNGWVGGMLFGQVIYGWPGFSSVQLIFFIFLGICNTLAGVAWCIREEAK